MNQTDKAKINWHLEHIKLYMEKINKHYKEIDDWVKK